MVCDFHDALVNRKAIVTGRRNVGREKGETLRRKQFRILWPKMENRLTTRAKKLFRERQKIRCPCTRGEHDNIAADRLLIFEQNARVVLQQPDNFRPVAQIYA